jgi:hypothetical protein
MTLLARIEADLALCEKQHPGTHGGRTCEGANMNERATLRALKVAVEGLDHARRCFGVTAGQTVDPLAKEASAIYEEGVESALRAIERELTGGTE